LILAPRAGAGHAPTLFVKGEAIAGKAPFEEFDKKIKSLLKG
jgi:protein-disulfide isomerase